MRLLNQSFRLYVEPSELESTISFYEELQGTTCERRIVIPHIGIEVAVIGSFILLAGSAEALKDIRHVQATLTVDSLDRTANWLREKGAEILSGPREAATGRNLTARNPDGLVAEYFEAEAH